MDVLVNAYPRTVGIRTLIDAVYHDDPDGGPLAPEAIIQQRITRIRRILPEYGWALPRSLNGRGNRGRYRLERLE